MLHELITKARTHRRFKEHKAIDPAFLTQLADAARLSPSPRNQQSLKYMILSDSQGRSKLFPHTAWAGALKDWKGPAEGERPAAYILIFDDLTIVPDAKQRWEGAAAGIAVQSMVLTAAEQGIASCIIAALNRKAILQAFDIPAHLNLLLVLALGYPAESVQLETMQTGADFNYYRDEQGIHHVPKRPLDEILLQ